MISSAKILFVLFFLSIFSTFAYAQTKVVVIPMSGDDLKPLANIVTVAKENGDFTDPVDAINSIPITGDDAPSAINPYLIVIAPGVYTITERLEMREYISVSGSGQHVTRLMGVFGSAIIGVSRAMVVGANNATLRDITIENESDFHAIGIYNDASMTILNVTVVASGNDGSKTSSQTGIHNLSSTPIISGVTVNMKSSGTQYGISNRGTSAPTISDTTITHSGGGHQYCIYNTSTSEMISISNVMITGANAAYNPTGIFNNTGSSPAISDITIILSGGGGQHKGIWNRSSSATISNVNISISNGIGSQTGIYNDDSSSPAISNTKITLSGGGSSSTQTGIFNVSSFPTISQATIYITGGSTQYGVNNASSIASARIRNSTISANTFSVSAGNGALGNETYISDSILTGGVDGNPRCSFVFTSAGVELGSDCMPLPSP